MPYSIYIYIYIFYGIWKISAIFLTLLEKYNRHNPTSWWLPLALAWTLLRYKFLGFNFISPLTKIPTQAHKLFWVQINIPHIFTQIFSMLLDSHQYSLYKPHKLPWALSQILPIISHILSNLGFHKNLTILLPKLSHKIIPSL